MATEWRRLTGWQRLACNVPGTACTLSILLGVPTAWQMAGSRFSHNFQRGSRRPGGAGAVMRVVYLGGGLNVIGVDEHIGRAFVLSEPGNNDGQPTGLGTVSVLDTRRGVLTTHRSCRDCAR